MEKLRQSYQFKNNQTETRHPLLNALWAATTMQPNLFYLVGYLCNEEALTEHMNFREGNMIAQAPKTESCTGSPCRSIILNSKQSRDTTLNYLCHKLSFRGHINKGNKFKLIFFCGCVYQSFNIVFFHA